MIVSDRNFTTAEHIITVWKKHTVAHYINTDVHGPVLILIMHVLCDNNTNCNFQSYVQSVYHLIILGLQQNSALLR